MDWITSLLSCCHKIIRKERFIEEIERTRAKQYKQVLYWERLALEVPMGFNVPAQGPRSLKPSSTPFQLPSSQLGWSWLSCPAPCHAKPHGKPPAPQDPRKCLSSGKDDRSGSKFHLPNQTGISFPVPFHFNLHVQEKKKKKNTHTRDKDCMLDCEPQPLPHTKMLCFLLSHFSYLQFSVAQRQSNTSKN